MGSGSREGIGNCTQAKEVLRGQRTSGVAYQHHGKTRVGSDGTYVESSASIALESREERCTHRKNVIRDDIAIL